MCLYTNIFLGVYYRELGNTNTTIRTSFPWQVRIFVFYNCHRPEETDETNNTDNMFAYIVIASDFWLIIGLWCTHTDSHHTHTLIRVKALCANSCESQRDEMIAENSGVKRALCENWHTRDDVRRVGGVLQVTNVRENVHQYCATIEATRSQCCRFLK